MKKDDAAYLLYKLITIAALSIAVNIAMSGEFTHPYALSGLVFVVGVWSMLKASTMKERISLCFQRRASLGTYIAESLFFIGFAVVSLAVFRYFLFLEKPLRALFFGSIFMMTGMAFYIRRCQKESR